MTETAVTTVEPEVPARGFWRSLFTREEAAPEAREPFHCGVPVLRDAEIAAVYYDRRIGGDFYEFLRVSPSRVLFALLDMAGGRSETRETLIAAQNTFRTQAPVLFGGDDINEATAMMRLLHEMNHTILLFGVRSCPAFIGCYNEDLATICYANAGHTPAMLRDRSQNGLEVTLLEATGLPLGLFLLAPQSASTRVLAPDAALLAVSRGIVETEYAGEEFGLDRTVAAFQNAGAYSAHGLCLDILQAIQNFTRVAPTHNDVTALVLRRHHLNQIMAGPNL